MDLLPALDLIRPLDSIPKTWLRTSKGSPLRGFIHRKMPCILNLPSSFKDEVIPPTLKKGFLRMNLVEGDPIALGRIQYDVGNEVKRHVPVQESGVQRSGTQR